jgi:DNA ligase-associated metallophosphoesterase
MTPVERAGESLGLMAERAVFWPRRKTLFVADTHFGKDAHFRRSGIPIPMGSEEADLDRLGSALDRCGAERLVILGDFFHANPHPDEPFMAAFAAWCERRSSLHVEAVIGNHDRHGGCETLADRVAWRDDPVIDPPFVLRHEPEACADGYVLAGHVHPVVRFRGAGADRLRLPVFWFAGRVAVLPSFGSFTGGHAIRPGPGDGVYAAGPDGVLPVSGTAEVCLA